MWGRPKDQPGSSRDPKKEKTKADSSRYNFDPESDHGKKVFAAINEIKDLLKANDMKGNHDQVFGFIYELHAHYRDDKRPEPSAVTQSMMNLLRLLIKNKLINDVMWPRLINVIVTNNDYRAYSILKLALFAESVGCLNVENFNKILGLDLRIITVNKSGEVNKSYNDPRERFAGIAVALKARGSVEKSLINADIFNRIVNLAPHELLDLAKVLSLCGDENITQAALALLLSRRQGCINFVELLATNHILNSQNLKVLYELQKSLSSKMYDKFYSELSRESNALPAAATATDFQRIFDHFVHSELMPKKRALTFLAGVPRSVAAPRPAEGLQPPAKDTLHHPLVHTAKRGIFDRNVLRIVLESAGAKRKGRGK